MPPWARRPGRGKTCPISRSLVLNIGRYLVAELPACLPHRLVGILLKYIDFGDFQTGNNYNSVIFNVSAGYEDIRGKVVTS